MTEQILDNTPEFTKRALSCAKDIHEFLDGLDLEDGGSIEYHNTRLRIARLKYLQSLEFTPTDIKDEISEGIAHLNKELESTDKITVSFLSFPDPSPIKKYRTQIESVIFKHGGVLDVNETQQLMTLFDDYAEFSWIIQENWTDKFRNPSFVYSFS